MCSNFDKKLIFCMMVIINPMRRAQYDLFALVLYHLLDSADSKSLIPLSFLADAPAACDAASEPVQVASLVLFRRRCMEILDRW